MIHNTLRNHAGRFLGGAILALGLASGGAAAEKPAYGTLGLYAVKDPAAFDTAFEAFTRDIGAKGCTVRRAGRIAGQNGDMDIAKPDRFFVLGCAAPLLRDARTRAVFGALDAAADRVALLEGEAEQPAAGPSGATATQRAYVLKLSRYTNIDPDGRERDLADIRAAAAARADRWRPEVFLTVSHAVGMETPDEVAVLYYDSPEQGRRFRESNPDVLKSIGRFNKQHLSGYIYYSGAASR